MTFDELKTVFLREVVADATGDVWDADAMTLLKNASAEIAAVLGFPQVTASGDLLANATAIIAPTGIAGMKVTQVIIGPWNLEPVSYAQLLTLRKRGGGVPVAYSFDPRRGGNIEIAPAPNAPHSYAIEYVKALVPSGIINTAAAWEGRFPDWHWLIPLRAGQNAWRMVSNSQQADYFESKFMSGLQAFAAVLGDTTLANMMIPPEQRSDRGSVSE
jgi:hypothetical protein